MLCRCLRVRSLWFSCLLALFSTAFVTAAAAQTSSASDLSPTGWSINLGVFDIIDSDKAFEGGVEYHFRPFRFWKLDLVPMVGASATEEGSYWGYGGMRYDVPLGSKWVMTPHFSISLYEQGDDGKDLGGVVEFRSGLELAYRFEDGGRFGMSFYHLSNARIYDLNPGSESLVLFYKFGR